jgi:predicted esterase
MCHGTQDQVVKEAYGQRSAGVMTKDLGMTVDYKRYPMAHSACPVRSRTVGALSRVMGLICSR